MRFEDVKLHMRVIDRSGKIGRVVARRRGENLVFVAFDLPRGRVQGVEFTPDEINPAPDYS